MLYGECWISIKISSKSFVTLTSMMKLKLKPTLSILFRRKKTWKTLLSPKTGWVERNALKSLHRHFHCQRNRQLFSKKCCNTQKNTIRGNQVSLGQNLNVAKGCVCTVKRIAAMIKRAVSTNSATKDWTNELWKPMPMCEGQKFKMFGSICQYNFNHYRVWNCSAQGGNSWTRKWGVFRF